jgi:hypothetical protein
MASTTGSLTTTGSVTLSPLPGTDTLTLVQVSGTYGTASYVIEGTADGTNWSPVQAVALANGASVSGTITPADNAELLYHVPSAMLSGVRLRATAVGSGTLGVLLASGAFVGLPQYTVQTSIQTITTALTDPGASGAIPVANSGYVPLVSAGAETRTLAAPTFSGQELLLYMKTDGGDITLTCSTTFNETGNNTAVFGDTGDAIRLVGVEEGSNRRWRITTADGVSLSTV